ncbi:MAG: hypothetical protein HC896_16045 [Bacteroidales bacterium]|nr:hypothetical protein [Bacteroidales bacterium]
MSIQELNNCLVSGDKVYVARLLPGELKQNKVAVSEMLAQAKPPRRGKRLMAYKLAVIRARRNQQFANEILTEAAAMEAQLNK